MMSDSSCQTMIDKINHVHPWQSKRDSITDKWVITIEDFEDWKREILSSHTSHGGNEKMSARDDEKFWKWLIATYGYPIHLEFDDMPAWLRERRREYDSSAAK